MSGKAPGAGLAPESHILCLAGPHDPHDEKSKHFCDLRHSHLACEIRVCELGTECRVYQTVSGPAESKDIFNYGSEPHPDCSGEASLLPETKSISPAPV